MRAVELCQDRSFQGQAATQRRRLDDSNSEKVYPATKTRRDYMMDLPCVLLGKIWPPERVVVGLRVCKWLHCELLQHVDKAVIEGIADLGGEGGQKGASYDKRAEIICADFKRLNRQEISLRWQRREGDKAFRDADVFFEGMRRAVEAGTCTQLTVLELRPTRSAWRKPMDKGTLSKLSSVISANARSLSHLNLENNFILDFRGMEGALAPQQSLTHLNLNDNRLGDRSMGSLAKALTGQTQLTTLQLAGNEIGGEGLEELVGALGGLAVTRLELSSNNLGVAAAVGALTALRRLRQLELRSNALRGEGLHGLARVLQQCTALAALDIGDNHIGARGVGALAPWLLKSSALGLLRLDLNGLDDGGAGRLASVLGGCQSLTALDLGRNRIKHVGAQHLASVLGSCSGLARLNLAWNDLGCGGCAQLAKVLQGCPQLTTLDLCRNEIAGAGVAVLAEALGECRLLALDLSRNKLQAEGAAVVARALARCSSLSSLRLGDCELGDSGASELARALGGEASVTVLDLSDNGLSDAAAASLALALPHCSALHTLSLKGNVIALAGAEQLVAAGAARGVQRMDLRGNRLAGGEAAGLAGLARREGRRRGGGGAELAVDVRDKPWQRMRAALWPIMPRAVMVQGGGWEHLAGPWERAALA